MLVAFLLCSLHVVSELIVSLIDFCLKLRSRHNVYQLRKLISFLVHSVPVRQFIQDSVVVVLDYFVVTV